MLIEAETLESRHPPCLFHPRPAACPTAFTQASMAASARATIPPASAKIAPAWRRRLASRRHVAHRLPDPLAGRVVVAKPVAGRRAPTGRRHRHPHARSRHRRRHGRLRTGPVRRSRRAGDRRRPRRLARCARGRRGGDGRSDGTARRGPKPHPRRDRADDPPEQLRGRPRTRSPVSQPRTLRAAFLRAATRDGHALFDLAGFIGMRLDLAGIRQIEDLALCTYADPARFFSFRRSTHRGEADYGRHINAITLPHAAR